MASGDAEASGEGGRTETSDAIGAGDPVDGGDSVEDDGAAGDIAATDIHDVLRNERRRLVLERLTDLDGPASVSDLAEHVAALEVGADPPPDNRRQSVYVSLHQTHLPKLNELGIVDYDTDEKTVALTDRAGQVTVYLEVVPQYGISRNELYLGLSLLGILVALSAAVGVPGIAAVEPGTWALVALGFVAVAAGFYTANQGETVLDRL